MISGRSSRSQMPRDKAQTEAPLPVPAVGAADVVVWLCVTAQSPSSLGLLPAGGGLLLAARGLVNVGVGPAMLSRALRLGGLSRSDTGVLSETGMLSLIHS